MGEISWKEKLEPIEEVNIKIQERICGLNHNFGRKETDVFEKQQKWLITSGMENKEIKENSIFEMTK